MAELSGIYGADPFANMTPEEFLQMAQGQGLGKVPVSTEFPGLGSDFGGIDRYLERKAEDSYKGIDPSVLANQAEAGNALAAAELANREGEFGGLGLPLDSATEALELPEIDMSGLDVEYQMEQAAKKKAQGEAAEAFRANEAKLAGSQGGLNSMGISEAAVTQEQADEGFLAAMDDFIEAARGVGPEAPKERTIEEYKRVFSEATGIDTSGKVDKKDALMAFGLALMQNKAGKGFNVGKMLQSVGEAGDKALPALQRAKAQARQDGIAAGKYALEMQSADKAKAAAAREKAMARENYYVVPRSEDVKGFLAGIGEGKGRLESLSKYEVDKLLKNPEFASKYDILPGSTWGTVVEEALKTPEGKDLFLDKKVEIPLFEGVTDDLFKIRVYDPDPNSNPNGRPIMAGDGQEQYEALARMARDTQKAKEQFVDLGVLNEGTSIYRYTIDSLNSVGSAFGLQFGNDVPETQRMKMILEKMQAKNAPAILGEAGKTISDADRARVAAIVGTIGATTDPRELQAKFEGLFNDIILGAESDIQQGLSTLNRYTNRNIGDAIGSGDLNEEEQAELLAGLKGLGVNIDG